MSDPTRWISRSRRCGARSILSAWEGLELLAALGEPCVGMALERNSVGRWIAERLAAAFSSSIPGVDARMSDEETSIQVLRAGSSIAILFLLAYLVYDFWTGQAATL